MTKRERNGRQVMNKLVDDIYRFDNILTAGTFSATTNLTVSGTAPLTYRDIKIAVNTLKNTGKWTI